MKMEIERKFLVKDIPDTLDSYGHRTIEQGYLNKKPVVRIRQDGEEYYLTYKGSGLLSREEYNLPLDKESYVHIKGKCDGHFITKERYLIPYGDYNIELDVFAGHKQGLVMAEVEFGSIEEAGSFVPPEWFEEEVTDNPAYQNVNMI